jgi:hypothetical protein
MDALYTRATVTAGRLLKRYAQGQYTLTRTSAGAVDADAPWEIVPAGVQSWDLNAIGKSVSRQFVDGRTVVSSDREVLAAAFGDQPRTGDVLTKDGVALTVVRVMPVTDAGVAWRFIVKG